MVTVKVKKGQIIEIEIDNLAYGGDGVGHLDQGLAVFVKNGIPGEKVKAKITQKKQNFARAERLDILKQSGNRVHPPCKVYQACGGCQLQHIDYKAQLIFKQKMVKDALERIGGFKKVKINQIQGQEYPWKYRNKAQFPFTTDKDDNVKVGFFSKGTHKVVTNNNCLIQHPLINRIVKKTLKAINRFDLSVYDEHNHQGLLRHLLVRVGTCTNQALVTFITRTEKFPAKNQITEELLAKIPELKGVLQNINPKKTNVILGQKTRVIKGAQKITDYIGSLKFEISPESFFQVNTLQTQTLYDNIIKFGNFKGNETIIDAYCGIGSISLYLAAQVDRVYGIESLKKAVLDAQNNAKINQIDNCIFIQGLVEEKVPQLIKNGIKADIMIFDPPRKGLNQELIDFIIEYKPEQIIYVSCNPTTLARDLKKLDQIYKIEEVQPVDMFSQTYHIETVTSLILK